MQVRIQLTPHTPANTPHNGSNMYAAYEVLMGETVTAICDVPIKSTWLREEPSEGALQVGEIDGGKVPLSFREVGRYRVALMPTAGAARDLTFMVFEADAADGLPGNEEPREKRLRLRAIANHPESAACTGRKEDIRLAEPGLLA